jgi:hypothetical protein
MAAGEDAFVLFRRYAGDRIDRRELPTRVG